MEYLNGGELLKAIAKRKYYTEHDARRVMNQITGAVEYLHQVSESMLSFSYSSIVI